MDVSEYFFIAQIYFYAAESHRWPGAGCGIDEEKIQIISQNLNTFGVRPCTGASVKKEKNPDRMVLL